MTGGRFAEAIASCSDGANGAPVASGSGRPGMSRPDALSVEGILARDGVWISTTAGVSMWPMLRNCRETIVVRPPQGRLRPFDVALYRRGNAYVLHRVIDVGKDGYRIIGDNCIEYEQVNESQVIGVLDEYWRGERHCDPHSRAWLAYARVWHAVFPVRRIVKRARAAAGRLKRRVLAR